MKKTIRGMRSSHYLHAEQQSRIGAWKRQWVWRSELPTWCVLIAIYAGWALVVYHWEQLGKWLGTPLFLLVYVASARAHPRSSYPLATC